MQQRHRRARHSRPAEYHLFMEPEASPWQNNSNQFSAQPDVFVQTDVSFIVTATTSAGCIIRDTVLVSINDNPVIPDAPDTSTCLGTGVRIGSPAISGVTYQWSPAAGNKAVPSVAQPIANPSSTTTYTVIAGFPVTVPAWLQIR